jgi:hypothetical protein
MVAPTPVPPPIPPPIPPAARIVVGADIETGLIQAGDLTPPLVCVSTSVRCADGSLETELLLRDEGLAFYHRVLSDRRYVLVIHNAPYDLSVACNEDPSLVPLVFAAFNEGRIVCTITLQKLIDVALGQRKFRRPTEGYHLRTIVKTVYDLGALIALYYDEHVEKADTWRMSYGYLIGFPLTAWPPSAKHYAMLDAELHLRAYEAQMRFIAGKWGVLPDQDPQQRAAFALTLMGEWGIRAEKEATDRFLAHCEAEIDKMRRVLHAHPAEDCVIGGCDHGESGILKADNTRFMKEIRRRVEEDFKARGVPVPRTDPSAKFPDGQVKTDEETLHKTKDAKLHLLADSMTFDKHRGQWGPVLRAAVKRPVCCRYNVLVDNGRTSCSGDKGQEGTNVQNPPRKGDVRPCIVPRRGWVLCSTDADTIELRANAQNCLEMVGFSRMAEAINNQFHHGGPDLHVVLGSGVAGISRAEAHRLHNEDDVVFANVRQLSKHANFAFAGGAGAETFVAMCHGFGIKLGETYEEELIKANFLRSAWFDMWTEERPYFAKIGDMIAMGRKRVKGVQLRGTIRQLVSGRIRGDTSFTAAANSFFSGRVADAFKEVLWNLAQESYLGVCTKRHVHGGSSHCTYTGRSVLEGSRTSMFLHDEPFMEHPEDGSESDRAEKQEGVVVDVLNRWMPQVPCTSSAVLMRRWAKGGKQLRVNGRIVPVKPVKVVVEGKEKVKWVHDQGDTVLPSVPDNYEINPMLSVAA